MDYKHNYDAFPLIFMLYEDPDNFSGINFHYLSPKLRAILLGHMFTFLTDKDFSNRTRLFGRKFMFPINIISLLQEVIVVLVEAC